MLYHINEEVTGGVKTVS